MQTFSAEEYEKKYGNTGAWSVSAGGVRPSIYEALASPLRAGTQNVTGYVKNVAKDYYGAASNIVKNIQTLGNTPEAGLDQPLTWKGTKAISNMLIQNSGEVVGAVFAPLTEILKPIVNKSADVLSSSKTFQSIAAGEAGSKIAGVENAYTKWAAQNPNKAKDLEAAANTILAIVGEQPANKLAGQGLGAAEKGLTSVAETPQAIKSSAGELAQTAKSAISEAGEKISPTLKSAVRDITPTSERITNYQITRALDLTQGDVKNIHLSTGNEVGEFIADKNLIGNNVAETQAKLKDYFKQNYDYVRSEIAKVDKPYKQANVPRYTEALTELKKQVGKVPGLQESNAEVNALLKKKIITLNDVQRVKELMDDHFSLYKATGDVREGIAKEGLANIRKDLRSFIEKEVKQKTGTDIKELNNNVATTKSIIDAVEYRSTRGLSRAHLTLSDIGLLGGASLFGGPWTAAAAVIIKKIYESPSIQLKIAKFFDKISDAKKAAITADIAAGKLPPEIKKLVK